MHIPAQREGKICAFALLCIILFGPETECGPSFQRGPAQAGLPSVVARCEEYIRGKEARMWAKLEEAQAAAMEECTFAPKITPYQWKTSGKVFDRLTRPAPKVCSVLVLPALPRTRMVVLQSGEAV